MPPLVCLKHICFSGAWAWNNQQMSAPPLLPSTSWTDPWVLPHGEGWEGREVADTLRSTTSDNHSQATYGLVLAQVPSASSAAMAFPSTFSHWTR
jgi:hypothetical protein